MLFVGITTPLLIFTICFFLVKNASPSAIPCRQFEEVAYRNCSSSISRLFRDFFSENRCCFKKFLNSNCFTNWCVRYVSNKYQFCLSDSVRAWWRCASTDFTVLSVWSEAQTFTYVNRNQSLSVNDSHLMTLFVKWQRKSILIWLIFLIL